MFSRKGQSTLEYAIVIAVVVAALMLMQHYFKRSIAGRYRTAADDLSQGEQFDPAVYRASNIRVDDYSYVRQTTRNKRTDTTHLSDQTHKKTIASERLTAWGGTEDLYSR